MSETRQCLVCEKYLSLDDFYASNKSTCKACISQRSRRWQIDNVFEYLALQAAARQRKRGLDLPAPEASAIEIVWHACGEECAICHHAIALHLAEGSEARQAELDAVIPSRGYVRGNMVFLCNQCNRRKDNSTWEWIERFRDFLLQHTAKIAD